MSLNVGSADRLIRVVIGGALIWMAFSSVLTGKVAMTAYIIGSVGIFTGLVRFCPAYVLIGVNTGLDKQE
ncbi:MAG: hypothetical protein CL797_09780 [Chromatiales bacterium]|nr:hypothetical protein [Chromatiales bacterium]